MADKVTKQCEGFKAAGSWASRHQSLLKPSEVAASGAELRSKLRG